MRKKKDREHDTLENMDSEINVQPLSHKRRKLTFLFLVFLFLASLPFLYMYATGYRFDFRKPTNFVSTGGIYIAVELPGASIYIDDELMRETRTFRKAFYAQGLDSGTHKVHVQKDGYHTWVKELPVTKGLVTEAEAFNFPLVPQVRVITEWQSATGSMIIATPIVNASSTNAVLATTTKKFSGFIKNPEYTTRIRSFISTSTHAVQEPTTQQIKDIILGTGTTTEDATATSTVKRNEVTLYRSEEDVFATWTGSFEQMPYYYCAPAFPRYNTTIATSTELDTSVVQVEMMSTSDTQLVIHPVQTVPKGIVCDPTIRIDRLWQTVHDFDFLPGRSGLVIMVLDNGVYAVEIDNRSWQNAQPLFMGKDLRISIEDGNLYVYDGTRIYQIILTIE